MGLSRLNDFEMFVESCGLNAGEINFCAGSPGATRKRINIRVINKNRTTREVAIRFITSLDILLITNLSLH